MQVECKEVEAKMATSEKLMREPVEGMLELDDCILEEEEAGRLSEKVLRVLGAAMIVWFLSVGHQRGDVSCGQTLSYLTRY